MEDKGLVTAVHFCDFNMDMDMQEVVIKLATYIIYLMLIYNLQRVWDYAIWWSKPKIPFPNPPIDWQAVAKNNSWPITVTVAAAGVLLYNKQVVLREELFLMLVAYVVVRNCGPKFKPVIKYGTGMACSYLEGYLVHILPSNGSDCGGFEELIQDYEASEQVTFPVKKLFIVVTKDLYCPPDLKEFNRKGFPRLEACKSFGNVTKSVAGVIQRKYRNAAYAIKRNDAEGDQKDHPVFLAVECATPLHTLHKVLKNKQLYDTLTDLDVRETMEEFCGTLQHLINKGPDYQGKCELVFYDHADESQNLAQILLNRVEELETNFEAIIRNHWLLNHARRNLPRRRRRRRVPSRSLGRYLIQHPLVRPRTRGR